MLPHRQVTLPVPDLGEIVRYLPCIFNNPPALRLGETLGRLRVECLI